MGMIIAPITLTNRWQLRNERREPADDFDVRQMEVQMLVDTGSYYMCINEAVFQSLALTVLYRKEMALADGTVAVFDVAGPIEARFSNRVCMTDAIVLPGNSECLLGAIPMEAMDVVVHPKLQELTVNPDHPEAARYRL